MKSKHYMVAGVIAIAFGAVGLAQAHDRGERDMRVIVRHGPDGPRGMDFGRLDANTDGFLSREEVSQEANRQFLERDVNSDGKLDGTDTGGREGIGQRAVNIERRMIIIDRSSSGDDGPRLPAPPRPPEPPHPPAPPAFLMIFANAQEADLNKDGALSKDEFVGQQLRFFDAADADRDGRIRFEAPPKFEMDDIMEAPEPPEPPKPPEPPELPAPLPPKRR